VASKGSGRGCRVKKEKFVSKTILVVDDEEEILTLVSKILSEDYRVERARNGLEMFQVLESVKPDLILLDVMMPASEGYELCRQLKSASATQDIPVVLLTVLATPASVRKGMEMGASAYLTKPFDPFVLGREIKTLLQDQ